jgi:hypothetical protein
MSSGSSKWAKTYGGHWRDIGLAIDANASGEIYLTGLFNGTSTFSNFTLTSYPGSFWADFFVCKIIPPPVATPLLHPAADKNDIREISAELQKNSLESHWLNDVKIYPNPFHEKFIINTSQEISIKIYDLKGRMVVNKENVFGIYSDGENLQAGIYIVEISDGISRELFRICKE